MKLFCFLPAAFLASALSFSPVRAAPKAETPAAATTAKPEPQFSNAVNAKTTLTKAPPRPASTRAATKKASWLPATIVIPALGVRAPLVRGVDTPSLRYGVGYDPDSDAIGAKGNAVIAGHRNIWGSYFWYLPRLQKGDTVMIEARQTQYFYRVETSRVVQPHETQVLDAAPDSTVSRLTLYTCTKPKTECRFIVSARLYQTLDISRQPEKSRAVSVPKHPVNKRTPPPLPKTSASTRNALPATAPTSKATKTPAPTKTPTKAKPTPRSSAPVAATKRAPSKTKTEMRDDGIIILH